MMDTTQTKNSSVLVDTYTAVTGTQGNDSLQPLAARSFIDGLGGADVVDYSAEMLPLVVAPTPVGDLIVSIGGREKDLLRNIEKVIGGPGDDLMSGTAANEVFRGGPGRDVLDGGAGFDGAEYSDKAVPVVVDLSAPGDIRVMVGGHEEDSLRNIESVIGGSGNDILTGSASVNVLAGGAGDDTLIAKGGMDILWGGEGADTFVFGLVSDSPADLPARIMDFSLSQGDRIDLSGIDANANTDGFQALAFSGENPGVHSAWYSKGADYGAWYSPPMIRVDVTGDAVEDMMISVDTDDAPFQVTAASLGLVADLA